MVTYSISLLLKEDKYGADILYMYQGNEFHKEIHANVSVRVIK